MSSGLAPAIFAAVPALLIYVETGKP